MIQIPKADVNAWEAGKSVPPNAVIAKMEKVLGVKLPRPSKHWTSNIDSGIKSIIVIL